MATKIACPHCRAVLTSSRAPQPGKTVKCPRCNAPFTIPGSVAAPVPTAVTAIPAPAPAPTAALPSGALNTSRLGYVLGGAFLYLTVGVALGAYCYSANQSAPGKGNKETVAEESDKKEAPAEPPLVNPPPEEQARVNQAINRAIRYLKMTQQANGTWPAVGAAAGYPVGSTALAGLTLLEGGVPANDPNVQKAAAYLVDNAPNNPRTYELSLTILFLDRLGEAKNRNLIRTLALRLIAGQSTTGGWTYTCPMLNSDDERQLSEYLSSTEVIKYNGGLDKLPPALRGVGVLQDPNALRDDNFRNFAGDNSNTQFAILGVWASRKYDVPLDRTAALLDRRFRNSQRPDGSWTYHPGGNVSQMPTMTAAGLLGLAVSHGVQSDAKVEKDAAIDRAFDVLARTIGESKGRKSNVPMVDLYYLWSVERVAVLYQKKKIGEKDWYGWGSEMLLANQKDDGSWQTGSFHGSSPTIDTCFATLFLRQANLAKDLTSKLQRLAGK